MSPNGTLMAYTTPIDIRNLRDQAALISMAWKDHTTQLKSRSQDSTSTTQDASLETLTIETANNNIIVRAIQPSLLLVLVGAVPPSRKDKQDVFKISPEARGEARYPPTVDNSEDGNTPTSPAKPPSVLSTMSIRDRDLKGGVLHIQRKKVDALTEYLRKDFDAKGFVMPDDSTFP